MFSYIRGILAEKNPDSVVVECNGVGFRIYTSQNSLMDEKCVLGANVTFYTYLYIKEGIMDLYGFSSRDELELFELLISVSGVGAKGASAILGTLNPAKLAVAIASGNSAEIKKAPGIGNKIAQRIVLELKDKISNDKLANVNTDAFAENIPIASSERDEAVNALIALGYSGAEAKAAVSKVASSVADIEEIIKSALKNLM